MAITVSDANLRKGSKTAFVSFIRRNKSKLRHRSFSSFDMTSSLYNLYCSHFGLIKRLLILFNPKLLKCILVIKSYMNFLNSHFKYQIKNKVLDRNKPNFSLNWAISSSNFRFRFKFSNQNRTPANTGIFQPSNFVQNPFHSNDATFKLQKKIKFFKEPKIRRKKHFREILSFSTKSTAKFGMLRW